jgi:phosphoribosylanthranilate isomerase
MAKVRVKICGVCRPQDAVAAATAGAHGIGIVLDPSAGRFVTIDNARQILAAVPPFVSTVALFVNAPTEEIKNALRVLPFAAVQLHGHEPPELVEELKPIRVIKAIHLAAGEAGELAIWREAVRQMQLTNLIGILVESARPTGPLGGSGVASNFSALRELKAAGHFDGLPPLIVAGGLTPENVAEAIGLLQPYAVDVSSGVESAHREKSASRIEAFVQSVRRASN